MTSGIGFSEILLVLVITVIFVEPKQIPGLIRKSVKIVAQLRAAIKKFIDELDVK
jgi:Tat protein translocase TatB subunit